jgi:DNA-binding transcriptional ArsR family regulator
MHKDRMATNPLTDERLIVRKVIGDFVSSARLDVLQILDEGPMSPSTVQNHGQLTRPTVSNHLAEFTDRGLTKSVGDQGAYMLTAGGKLTLDAIEKGLDEIGCEQLAYLTRSSHSIQLLRALSSGISQPSELTDVGPSSPSRTTVRRALQQFATEG